MSSLMGKHITVKAMVDKENNRVVFVESDEDFTDVLFSFMTMPMGKIVSLTKKQKLPKMSIGCMNNLYASAKNLDVKYFRTRECQQMLMHPRNGARTQCRRLKISIDDHSYFICGDCCDSNIYYYDIQPCSVCGQFIYKAKLSRRAKTGAFLKGLNRFVISDDLQVMHPTRLSSFSFLSDLGVLDSTASALEVREFDITEDEVINLLTSSLVSKDAFTRALLYENELPINHLFGWSSSLKRKFQFREAENGEISVKLIISKSKKIVCFAEAGEDFIDLVFSFLTIPLGHVLKQLQGARIDGCVDNLYKSIDDLDVEFFKFSKTKDVLLNPKIPPKFGYENQLTGVEEVSYDVYFNYSDKTVKDPKIPTDQKEDKSNGGFMAGPAMFTVTDDLRVIPLSYVSRVTILNKLDVLLSDVEERVVHVGNDEAVRLLVASFGSDSALTHAFLKK